MTNEDRDANPLAPWRTLAERDSGGMTEPEFYEGVPDHLREDLVDWVANAARNLDDHVRAVLNRFRISWSLITPRGTRVRHSAILISIIGCDLAGIESSRPLDPLSVLDAFVALHPHWDNYDNPGYGHLTNRDLWIDQLVALQDLLRDTGSAWEISGELRGLVRRVDPTATEAWRQARELADREGRAAAAANLKAAWRETYGQSPSPSAGYSAAVKAVEAVVVPVIAPGTGRTVHAAARRLRDNLNQWQFTLINEPGLAAGTGAMDVVSAMLDRLLSGETDRHTSDPRNRESTQPEAEAAVHLAVILVQWFASGAVQPR